MITVLRKNVESEQTYK